MQKTQQVESLRRPATATAANGLRGANCPHSCFLANRVCRPAPVCRPPPANLVSWPRSATCQCGRVTRKGARLGMTSGSGGLCHNRVSTKGSNKHHRCKKVFFGAEG